MRLFTCVVTCSLIRGVCGQVADEIWVCEKQTVTKWEGTIFDYKLDITKRLEREQKKRNKQK